MACLHISSIYPVKTIHKLMNLQMRELDIARQQATLAAQRLRQDEDELQQLQTQWAVDRAEIQVTEEELGSHSLSGYLQGSTCGCQGHPQPDLITT